MRCWRCCDFGVALFCVGIGMIVSLLFSSGFLTALIGAVLIILGIVLAQKK